MKKLIVLFIVIAIAIYGGSPYYSAYQLKNAYDAKDGATIAAVINTQGQANTATKELAAAWAIASNQVDLKNLIQSLIIQRGDINAVVKNQMQQIIDKQAAELEQQAAQGTDSDKPNLGYCGINCFDISGQVKGYPLTIKMQRDGLINWKIVDIILPQ